VQQVFESKANGMAYINPHSRTSPKHRSSRRTSKRRSAQNKDQNLSNHMAFSHQEDIRSVSPFEERLLQNGDENASGVRKRSMTQQQIHDKMARMRCYCIPCMNYKFLIWQLVAVSVFLQSLVFLIVGLVEFNEHGVMRRETRLSGKLFLGILWTIQLTVMVQLMLICVRRLWHLTFSEIFQLYFTNLLAFTGVYVTAFFFDETYTDDDNSPFQAFNIDQTEFKDANYGERIVAFLYFSVSQQTLCGVCEIIPKSPPTMILAGLQICYGIFFSLVITSIGISRLGEDLEKRSQEQEKLEKKKESDNNMSMVSLRTNFDNLIVTTCWYEFTHHPTVILLRRKTRQYLLAIVIVVQAAKNVLEWQTSNSPFADHHPFIHTMLFVLFDVVNVMAVITTSLKFIRLGHMTELRLNFLCQTYTSCVLIFTGFYADLQVSYGSSDYANSAFVTNENTYLSMWVKFCYFSFASMTLCGAGLDVKPRTWYAALAVCIQMLLGLFFHVYIFGIGLLLLANKKANSKPVGDGRMRRSSSILSRERSVSATNPIGSELIMSTLLETQTKDLL